jgi:catechol 2,3-dioxygenase
MIDIKGIVHFTIPVGDPDRSMAFYRDVLGLEVVQRIPSVGMVFLRAGGDHVILTKSKTPIDPNPGREIFIHHAFRIDVDKYDAVMAELRGKGVDVVFEEDRRDGRFIGRQAYIHDPDRNVIEIIDLQNDPMADTGA